MLTRILTDNPGRLFTVNFDAKFVSTVKDLLKDGRDNSVQQILRETLDHFEAEKVKDNETLVPLVEMWRKQKGRMSQIPNNVPVWSPCLCLSLSLSLLPSLSLLLHSSRLGADDHQPASSAREVDVLRRPIPTPTTIGPVGRAASRLPTSWRRG